MDYQFLNLDYLELMSGGDQTDRRRLLEMLEKDLSEYPKLMQQTLEAEDWQKLERQAHYFKSTLPFTGYEVLIQTHHSVYQNIKEAANLADLPKQLSQVEAFCQAVQAEVQEELEKG
jgi:HPt (histidine-containing phosphotransfer) domain-containing protein